MDKFRETHKLPKEKQEEIENWNKQITNNKTELVFKNLPTMRSPGQESFMGEFYQTFKELLPTLLKLFQKTEEEGTFPN